MNTSRLHSLSAAVFARPSARPSLGPRPTLRGHSSPSPLTPRARSTSPLASRYSGNPLKCPLQIRHRGMAADSEGTGTGDREFAPVARGAALGGAGAEGSRHRTGENPCRGYRRANTAISKTLPPRSSARAATTHAAAPGAPWGARGWLRLHENEKGREAARCRGPPPGDRGARRLRRAGRPEETESGASRAWTPRDGG